MNSQNQGQQGDQKRPGVRRLPPARGAVSGGIKRTDGGPSQQEGQKGAGFPASGKQPREVERTAAGSNINQIREEELDESARSVLREARKRVAGPPPAEGAPQMRQRRRSPEPPPQQPQRRQQQRRQPPQQQRAAQGQGQYRNPAAGLRRPTKMDLLEDARKRKAQPYDWGKTEKFSPDQKKFLERIFRQFGDYITTKLAPLLQTRIAIDYRSMKLRPYSSFIQSLYEPITIVVTRVDPEF